MDPFMCSVFPSYDHLDIHEEIEFYLRMLIVYAYKSVLTEMGVSRIKGSQNKNLALNYSILNKELFDKSRNEQVFLVDLYEN